MLAASSNSTSIGGSSRPARRSAAATPARSTRSVSAATSGAADPPPSLLSRYSVCREAGNAAASNSANPRPAGGGVTQAVIAGLRRHLAATRAVKYTEPGPGQAAQPGRAQRGRRHRGGLVAQPVVDVEHAAAGDPRGQQQRGQQLLGRRPPDVAG